MMNMSMTLIMVMIRLKIGVNKEMKPEANIEIKMQVSRKRMRINKIFSIKYFIASHTASTFQKSISLIFTNRKHKLNSEKKQRKKYTMPV